MATVPVPREGTDKALLLAAARKLHLELLLREALTIADGTAPGPLPRLDPDVLPSIKDALVFLRRGEAS
jgi:hypothetical protein